MRAIWDTDETSCKKVSSCLMTRSPSERGICCRRCEDKAFQTPRSHALLAGTAAPSPERFTETARTRTAAIDRTVRTKRPMVVDHGLGVTAGSPPKTGL